MQLGSRLTTSSRAIASPSRSDVSLSHLPRAGSCMSVLKLTQSASSSLSRLKLECEWHPSSALCFPVQRLILAPRFVTALLVAFSPSCRQSRSRCAPHVVHRTRTVSSLHLSTRPSIRRTSCCECLGDIASNAQALGSSQGASASLSHRGRIRDTVLSSSAGAIKYIFYNMVSLGRGLVAQQKRYESAVTRYRGSGAPAAFDSSAARMRDWLKMRGR